MSDLTWAEICERFDGARNWWIATTGPDGPHTVPVWGVVVDQTLYVFGRPTGVRTRNLQSDPRLVAHLENGDQVLILHAEALAAGLAIDHAPVVQAYAAKYDEQVDLEYLPGQPGMDDNLLFQIAPKRAISWEVASSDNWVNRRWQVGA